MKRPVEPRLQPFEMLSSPVSDTPCAVLSGGARVHGRGEDLMMRLRRVVAVSPLLFLLSPAASRAADDVAALRAELEALKAEYSSRVTALESRITELESIAAAASAAPAAVVAEVAPPGSPGRGGASAFNPAISMILAGKYASLSQDPASYRIAGFIPSGSDIGPGPRSFNLGESELTVAANVDPYFFANVTASITSENQIAVEEAYFRTLALPSGLTLKGGRFFSALGYLNEVHAHAWDFVDQPLVYQAFFGGQLAQDGVQLKWVAPTETFVELGAEAGNGGAFPGTHRSRNSLNATVLFTHVGGDVGDSASWRTGVSWLDERADDRLYEDSDDVGAPVTNAFTGTSRTWIADAILKWAPHGDTTRQQLKVQAEYLRRAEDGSLTFDVGGRGLAGDYRSQQSGWYLQSVYQFRPRWRTGARYDSMDSGDPRIGLVAAGVLPRAAFPTLLAASPDRF